MAARVELLLEDYAFFVADAPALCERLDMLVEMRGKALVGQWQAQARAGDWPALLQALMELHYDPLYDRSMKGHYPGRPGHDPGQATGLDTAAPSSRELALPDASAATLDQAARHLLSSSS